MKIQSVNLDTLEKGTIIDFSAADLIGLRYIGTKEAMAAEDRKDGKADVAYERFALGNRVFTIPTEEQYESAIELLKDADKRKTIGTLQLEATEFERKLTDDNGDETGETVLAKAFRFHGVATADDVITLAENAGKIAQVEAKYAPKATGVDTKAIEQMIAKAVAAGLAKVAPVPANAE